MGQEERKFDTSSVRNFPEMRQPAFFASLTLAVVATLAVLRLSQTTNQSRETVHEIDDGEYEYDPFDTDDDANNLPDAKGSAPPVPKWHACRFSARKGGIYDLRGLSRNKKLFEAASKGSWMGSTPPIDSNVPGKGMELYYENGE